MLQSEYGPCHIFSVDGAYGVESATNKRVRKMDLTTPNTLRVYDWILCLEVGEHIPKKYESVLIDNIASHARVGAVISWAIPGQGVTLTK